MAKFASHEASDASVAPLAASLGTVVVVTLSLGA
jgi:hypothetical protein